MSEALCAADEDCKWIVTLENLFVRMGQGVPKVQDIPVCIFNLSGKRTENRKEIPVIPGMKFNISQNSSGGEFFVLTEPESGRLRFSFSGICASASSCCLVF